MTFGKVVSFPTEYVREDLETMDDKELLERANKDGECKIWDSIPEFQSDLNDDHIDTENNWFFFV